MRRGTLKEFHGTWGSGIGMLTIEDSKTKQTSIIPCENTATVRGLQAVFGNTITDGNTASGNGYKDKEVYWGKDELGLGMLGFFIPVDDAPVEWEEKWDASETGEFSVDHDDDDDYYVDEDDEDDEDDE